MGNGAKENHTLIGDQVVRARDLCEAVLKLRAQLRG